MAAESGKPWELLPEQCRSAELAMDYPIPSRLVDLKRLAAIPLPDSEQNPGNAATKVYLERAAKALKKRNIRRKDAALDAERRRQTIMEMQSRLKSQMTEATLAIEDVKQRAVEAIAGLDDLFALGRRGIDAQMRAHLAGEEWQGEVIDAQAFRQCFRMVSMAVKGLGLPSEQRQVATKTVMDQVAESLRATQNAVAAGPGEEDETEH